MQPCLRAAFCFLLLICAYQDILAQKTKITGKIIDADTKEEIPFANIFFKDRSCGTVADLDGNFSIEGKTNCDTLVFESLGYTIFYINIKLYQSQNLLIQLQANVQKLAEIVVTAGENPAYRIIRSAQKNKDKNRKQNLPDYHYQTYSKLKFGIKNITDKLKNRKLLQPFNFFFDNIDSTEGQPFLPVLLSETVSEVYYSKEAGEKELVTAAKVSGIKNESISAIFTDLAIQRDIHVNLMRIFNKNFITPISDNAFKHYDYELTDSSLIDNHWCYKIKFYPKRKQELTFTGNMWIADSSFAVKEIEAIISSDANINLITDVKFRQVYNQYNNCWFLLEDQMVIHGEVLVPHAVKTEKFFAKKHTSYKNFTFSDPNPIAKNKESSTFAENAYEYNDEYWNKIRHDTLSKNEIAVYHLVDSLRRLPLFKNYLSVFTGYKNFRYFELGPYYTLYNYNPVEGSRLKLNLRTTPELHKNILITGHVAYGLMDERWKYGAGIQYFFKHRPRTLVGTHYRHDVEQLGLSHAVFRKSDNLLATIFRIFPQNRLNFNTEYRLFLEHEWFQGFSNRIQFKHNKLSPLGKLSFERAENGFRWNIPDLTTSEVTLFTHFGYKEKFLRGDYNLLSLGSNYPIFDLGLVWGFKNIFGADYDYQKAILNIRHRMKTGSIGEFRYRIEGGKIWGNVPYPILEMHPGNQTFFLDENIFNTMNFFEFVSDQYASLNVSQHLEGYLLNRIPGIRKLKWREVISGRMVYGSLRNRNAREFELPSITSDLSQGPFAEAGIGIENIFRVFRIDYIQRLSYLDKPGANRFFIKGTVHLDF
ncbi:MAG: DUF5686 family protein [Cytophagaceae bacterium]